VLVDAETQGERIRIEGRVFDGIGTVLKDVLIGIWQANAEGKYAHPADRQPGKSIDPHFRGWGRSCTDFDSGVYSFDTIKPGPVEGRKGRIMAPHISAWVVARGINIGLNTRIYFSDEAAANAKDPVINLIEWEARRRTLVAERTDRRADNGAVVYRFDIRLQGDDETGLLRRLKTALRQDPTARAERRRPRRSRAANRSGPTRRHGRPPG
jgi:protocatechuate 3,4-dioxygenase alpha subunit